MNKTELISAMAERSGLSKKDTEKALNAALETITAALATGDRVQLVGFGTFETKDREARTGRNRSSVVKSRRRNAAAGFSSTTDVLPGKENARAGIERMLCSILGQHVKRRRI